MATAAIDGARMVGFVDALRELNVSLMPLGSNGTKPIHELASVQNVDAGAIGPVG